MLPYDENLNNHIDMDKEIKNILDGVTLVEMFSLALSKLEDKCLSSSIIGKVYNPAESTIYVN